MPLQTTKTQGLHTLSFALQPEKLENLMLYGFKLSPAFKEFLIQVELKLGKNSFDLKRLAGRTAFKLAATLHPDEVVHFHGSLLVAEANQDMWFYTLNPLDVEEMFRLEAHINEWLAKEAQTTVFRFDNLPMAEWGAFEAIALTDLLDTTRYKNGHSVLEKYFLSQLVNKTCPFLEDAPALMFHRVVSEAYSTVMSQPYFPKDRGPYSYVLTADVVQLPNTTQFLLEFKLSVRIWVMEKPSRAFHSYFKERRTTNAYFYTPDSDQAEGNAYRVFNQIGLRKRKDVDGEIVAVQSADRYFCEQMNVQLNEFLDRELTDFSFDDKQLLITVPNSARDQVQLVGAKNKEYKPTAYGVCIPERICFFNFIEGELALLGLVPQKGLQQIGGRITKTDAAHPRIPLYQTYGLTDFLLTEAECAEFNKTEAEKTTLTKEPFVYPGQSSVKIGVFAEDAWIINGHLGFTRALLGASQLVSISEDGHHHHYQTPEGFHLHFYLIQDPIAKELKTSKQARQLKEKVKHWVETCELDGALIEIGRKFGTSKHDPKNFLRVAFAELGIPVQFIHPSQTSLSSVKLKSDVENRTRAASKDLLAKLYFTEAPLRTCLDKQSNPLLIGISKIILDNGFHLPCLSKIEAGEVSLKLYPYDTWMDVKTVYQSLGKDYVSHVETAWQRPKAKDQATREAWLAQQMRRNTEWLTSSLAEFHPNRCPQRVMLFWDSRIEGQLLNFNLTSLDDWFTDLLGFELTNGSLLRWVDAVKSPDYLTLDKTGKAGKLKGIYQSDYIEQLFYTIGDRPLMGSRIVLQSTKWNDPSKIGFVMGLHQVYVYSKDSDIIPLEEVKFMHKMRKMILTQDIEASVPYPIYILRQLNELMDAFFSRYSDIESLDE